MADLYARYLEVGGYNPMMLILAMKPGHDGAIAVVEDGRLVLSHEGEKDSFNRNSKITPSGILDVADKLGQLPDVVALSGWPKSVRNGVAPAGAGYLGVQRGQFTSQRFFGKNVQLFTSTHERSHIFASASLRPVAPQALTSAALVWEGEIGAFYLFDQEFQVRRRVHVLSEPGARFAFLFGILDPSFPDSGAIPRNSDSGKLMAIAGCGDYRAADQSVRDAVELILRLPTVHPAPKSLFRGTPLHNAGVDSATGAVAASLLERELYRIFQEAAARHLPEGLDLLISGGCGLNCDWNSRWRESGLFSSVFVPPCPNDSGSAIGTAAEAMFELTGELSLDWTVYSGPDFVDDHVFDVNVWDRQPLDHGQLVSRAGSSLE